jgi:hypothetical protein
MQYATLDNLVNIRSGYPFRGPVRHDPAGDIRVLQIRDLRRPGALQVDTLSRVRAPHKHAAHLLQPGDIVMPARGEHREAASFALEEPTIPSSQLYTLRVAGGNVLPAYLSWALNQPPTQHAMQKQARGTAMPLLTRRGLGAIRIPVPKFATQQRIVELHELWQREQALTQQLFVNREHMLNGMIQQLMDHEQTETSGDR